MIHSSTSLFSLLVLLVKKINGSWRSCVDYKEHNKQNVNDKFLIPTIDKLLDKLKEAHYFSKLDLRSCYY